MSMTFLQKIKTHKTKPFQTPEQIAIKKLNRHRKLWKSATIFLLVALISLGFLFRNYQVTTELNTLKHDIEVKEELQKPLTSPQSNANDPKA